MPFRVWEMTKRIEDDGWCYAPSTGGHRQYKHLTKKGKVTIPSGHIPLGPANSILRKAGLK